MGSLTFSKSFNGRLTVDYPKLIQVGNDLLALSGQPEDELSIKVEANDGESASFKGFAEFQAFALQFPHIVNTQKIELRVSWMSSGSYREHSYISLTIKPSEVWLYMSSDDSHIFYSSKDKVIALAQSFKAKSAIGLTRNRIFMLQVAASVVLMAFQIFNLLHKNYSVSYALSAIVAAMGFLIVPINSLLCKFLLGNQFKLEVVPNVKRLADSE